MVHWVLDIGVLPASQPLEVPRGVPQSASADPSAAWRQ